jgi:hypothetical protein
LAITLLPASIKRWASNLAMSFSPLSIDSSWSPDVAEGFKKMPPGAAPVFPPRRGRSGRHFGPTMRVAAEAEQELGIPVLAANPVLYWHALRSCGHR